MKGGERVYLGWAKPKPGVDMWEWQDGRCAWCGWDWEGLVRDHCHETGLIRGLLCRSCNSQEANDFRGAWNDWRAGNNPAFITKDFEIYTGIYGTTPLSTRTALRYYTHAEREGWFEQIVTDLKAGAPWPADAPWTLPALERKEADDRAMRAALDLAFPPGWPNVAVASTDESGAA